MEAVGILAGSIVHNLNNMLAVILGHTRMAIHGLPAGAEAQEELGKVIKAGTMASELVAEISDFFRQADRARKPTDLGPLVSDTLKLLRDILPSTVEIREDLQPCGPVLASPAGVQQVLMNLCSNSVQAMMAEKGVIEISLREEKVSGWNRAVPVDLGPGSYVKLTLRDDGRGMDAATLDRIFESYFSVTAGGSKLGIGLSTVCRILKEHDGTTIPHSRVGAGTSFDIYFPLIAWPADQEPEAAADLEIVTPGPVGLAAVDGRRGGPGGHPRPRAAGGRRGDGGPGDAPRAAAPRLRRGRCTPTPAMRWPTSPATPTPSTSWSPTRSCPTCPGVRLTRRLHDIRPDVPVILFTGFRDSFNERQAREAGVLEFMLKPGSHRDLAQLLDRVMARRRAGEA